MEEALTEKEETKHFSYILLLTSVSMNDGKRILAVFDFNTAFFWQNSTLSTKRMLHTKVPQKNPGNTTNVIFFYEKVYVSVFPSVSVYNACL
jgi:hypothetical protein